MATAKVHKPSSKFTTDDHASPAESSKKPQSAAVSRGPTMLVLIAKALEQTDRKDGLSLQGLKTFLLRHYPDVAAKAAFRTRVKSAVLKGLEAGILKRAVKSRESIGVQGHFTLVSDTKPKKKSATKPSKRSRSVSSADNKSPDAEKRTKKTVKKVAKPRSRSKSPASSREKPEVLSKKSNATTKTAAKASSSTKKVKGSQQDTGSESKRPTPKKRPAVKKTGETTGKIKTKTVTAKKSGKSST